VKKGPRKGARASRVPAAAAAAAALLALSRDLAEARTEEQVTESLALALEALFPGRSFAVRLVDPKTLALRTLHARGRLRSAARPRIALRRSAVEKTGLAGALLAECGVLVTEVDEPLFEGSELATAVPLAVGGQLFGVVNLEYGAGREEDRERDAPLLYQLANHAALGVRNVRSIEELTYLKTLQAAAEHAERLAGIGRLVAGIVHELNNPLTAVNMYSDVLVEKLSHAGHDPGDVEKLRAILEGGQRIQRLARDLVAYARPAGARTEPVDLADVVEEAARLAKPALKERGAVLETRLLPSPPVEGSRASLVQVVVNLVTNAAHAVASGGRVTVALAPEDGGVRLTVEDDGAGMAEPVAARAFEPFFTTRPAHGIGLGLPIVQGIVERHGGTVALVTAPGAGTSVAVTLPVKHGR